MFEYIDREPIGTLKDTTAITVALVGAGPRSPPPTDDAPRPPPSGTPPAAITPVSTTASPSPSALLSPQTPMGVVFHDVHFCYPARRDTAVLRGLSFEARPGEVLALVGSSGSGKSTAFHLMERFYEAQVGVVTIDGRDVTTLDHAWLHQHVALVGQEPTLLSGTIASNIAYGLLDESTEGAGRGNSRRPESRRVGKDVVDEAPTPSIALYNRIVTAAREANAHDFIMGLPDGCETHITYLDVHKRCSLFASLQLQVTSQSSMDTENAHFCSPTETGTNLSPIWKKKVLNYSFLVATGITRKWASVGCNCQAGRSSE